MLNKIMAVKQPLKYFLNRSGKIKLKMARKIAVRESSSSFLFFFFFFFFLFSTPPIQYIKQLEPPEIDANPALYSDL